MTTSAYPFSAMVGQPELKLALLLASVDWRLSVLLKGDKGSGKSTAARALADILPADSAFVNLPIGATENRLLGGLDLDHAMHGQAKLKRGLIQEANGGVLYVDEINLLSDSLTDALLDVASSGRQYVERDGFSASAESRFILLGSMNAEEGGLRPQLLDRFSLALDVEAPAEADDRAQIVESRMRFDADPVAFCKIFSEQQDHLRRAIVEARRLVTASEPSTEILRHISRAITESGVRSLRADLAALRASIARAGLDRRSSVTPEDVESVLPLVLHHRAKPDRRQSSPPPQSAPSRNETRDEQATDRGGTQERVFPPEARLAPKLRVSVPDSIARGRSATVNDSAGDRVQSGTPFKEGRLDVVASLTQSFRNTGTASLTRDQLVFRRSAPSSGVRFIFVVDASGSHAAQQRMRAVKGAVAALLESSVDHKDEVAVISFRGAKAEIVLEPCRDMEAALRLLEFLPTGGRTPLAHALELAEQLVTPESVVVLLTDGRANVPSAGADPWAEALKAARNLTCSSVLVDSSVDSSTVAATQALAAAMRARLIRLDDLSREAVLNILRL